MNKAFVKEDDHSVDPEIVLDPAAGIPAGARNYMTPEGADRLRRELAELLHERRPRIIAQIGRTGAEAETARRQLRQVARRIEFLSGRLALTEVVNPAAQQSAQVRFGATVRVARSDGTETVFRIVGIDEADAARGLISWTAPLAKALLGKTAGDLVTPLTPSGREELEILEVSYDAADTGAA
jgi:transcription elongation factor GreB